MAQDLNHASLNRDRLIHILDPDPLTCEALSVLFRLEGFQTAFSVEVPGFLAAVQRRQPDAVIINFRAGHQEGLAMLHRIKNMRPSPPVFMIGNELDVALAVSAMKVGASDVFTKPIDNDLLLAAVDGVLRRRVRLHPDEGGSRQIEISGFDQLTPREREVLQLISNGQSNKEAGRELGISPRTIEVHRARVMEKLGARNTADLLRIVLLQDNQSPAR